jgi:hypothetical protein
MLMLIRADGKKGRDNAHEQGRSVHDVVSRSLVAKKNFTPAKFTSVVSKLLTQQAGSRIVLPNRETAFTLHYKPKDQENAEASRCKERRKNCI